MKLPDFTFCFKLDAAVQNANKAILCIVVEKTQWRTN